MTLTFVCQSCDDSFEVEHSQLADDARRLKCPGCGKRLPGPEMDELSATLDDLLSQVAALRKRFAISFEIDAEDLPAPYDADAKRTARHDEDEDEEDVEDDEDADLEDDEELGDDDEDDRF